MRFVGELDDLAGGLSLSVNRRPNPALTEAARGLGMSPRQISRSGRVAAGRPDDHRGHSHRHRARGRNRHPGHPGRRKSLGNYIFGGLESLNHLATVFGCVLAALLAIVLDQLLRLLEVAARRRSRATAGPVRRASAGGPRRSLHAGQPAAGFGATGWWSPAARSPSSTCSANLTRHLEQAGIHADQRPEMSKGSNSSLFDGQVDCIVNYSGNIWTLVMKRKDVPRTRPPWRKSLATSRPARRQVLGSLGFEDAYAFAMPRAGRGLGHPHDRGPGPIRGRSQGAGPTELRIGGDIQFFDRPEWRKVKATYGLLDEHVHTTAMNPTLMYGAVIDGQVDVIVAYTSDGRIPAFELTCSPTPNASPLRRRALGVACRRQRKEFLQTIRPLIGAIDLETMQNANYRVDVEKWPAHRAERTPGHAAAGISPAARSETRRRFGLSQGQRQHDRLPVAKQLPRVRAERAGTSRGLLLSQVAARAGRSRGSSGTKNASWFASGSKAASIGASTECLSWPKVCLPRVEARFGLGRGALDVEDRRPCRRRRRGCRRRRLSSLRPRKIRRGQAKKTLLSTWFPRHSPLRPSTMRSTCRLFIDTANPWTFPKKL